MLTAIAIVPVFLLLIYIYFQDTGHKEPLGFLTLVFLAGCFSVVPAIFMEQELSMFSFGDGVRDGLYTGFAVYSSGWALPVSRTSTMSTLRARSPAPSEQA